jgi:hypothetical protein
MRYIILVILAGILSTGSMAQIENVIVETYYLSDDVDKGDSTNKGTELREGSVTYRIFVDLAEGSAIDAITGSPEHPIVITSTEDFYNYNGIYFSGYCFGYEISKGKLAFGNIALDSWLTIGMATNLQMGIPKNLDSDGSIVGGIHNLQGLQSNVAREMGIPLIQSDGLIYPDSTIDLNKFFSQALTMDSTFGIHTNSNLFIYDDSLKSNLLQYSGGLQGPTAENIVMIGQFTTHGDLSFRINLRVSIRSDSDYDIVYHYVGTDTLTNNSENIYYSKWLNYPYERGCTDPFFAEYDPKAIIEDGSCSDSIKLGCADPAACNFNPSVNVDVPQLCCYGPDDCDNRNIDIVCPGYYNSEGIVNFRLYPNPAAGIINLDITTSGVTGAEISVISGYGDVLFKKELGNIDINYLGSVDISNLDEGFYLIKLITTDGYSLTKSFIKN